MSRVAARLQLDENLILLEMRKMPSRTGSTPELKFPRLIDQITPAEITLLTALLDEEWTDVVLQQLDPVLFEGLRTKEIFEKALRLNQQEDKVDLIRLRNLVTDEDDRSLLEGLALSSPNPPLSEEVIKSCVQALRKNGLLGRKRLTQQRHSWIQRTICG